MKLLHDYGRLAMSKPKSRRIHTWARAHNSPTNITKKPHQIKKRLFEIARIFSPLPFLRKINGKGEGEHVVVLGSASRTTTPRQVCNKLNLLPVGKTETTQTKSKEQQRQGWNGTIQVQGLGNPSPRSVMHKRDLEVYTAWVGRLEDKQPFRD